jgi:hypothetical protein
MLTGKEEEKRERTGINPNPTIPLGSVPSRGGPGRAARWHALCCRAGWAGWSVCCNTYLSLLVPCDWGVGWREKISTVLGWILLTLPAAPEYIPTGEGQIRLTVLDTNHKYCFYAYNSTDFKGVIL